jgi:arginyl-tRNA synthetase
MPLSNPFAAAAAAAVAEALELPAELFPVSAPPRPELGDFAVGTFPAAKQRKAPPPKLAAEVAARFQPTDLLAEATATGPYVNFKARRSALYAHLFGATVGGGSLVPDLGGGRAITIDYSSPNISKHLAYHHIRSTVIGHALVNMYRALGYRVIGINHLGDWGTTHGMLIAAYARNPPTGTLDIDALNEMYVQYRAAIEKQPELEDEARAWFKKLEDGDPEARRLWTLFRDVSLAEFQSAYDTLGIQFEEIRGESAYLDQMQPVIDMLARKGLTAESQGALVVPLGEDSPPLLLRKQDGATLYATRDLAAAIYRWETYQFERSLYVVDRGQGLHFAQLFETLKRAGFDWAARCQHVSFGLVRFGGKKTGSRSGNVILLKQVLREAAEDSGARIKDANPDMASDLVEATARMVGIGAVVFANLSSQREKDVDFEWEKILSVEGDSGPYIQYAHARCASIERKAGAVKASMGANQDLLRTDQEWALALELCRFGDVVARATDTNEPHLISQYLLELCATFSRWYTAGNQDGALRVITDDPALTEARLTLVAATRLVLRQGLGLLGIGAPDVM